MSQNSTHGLSRRDLLARAGIGVAGAAAIGSGIASLGAVPAGATVTTDFINVLNYGATGDGTTDDTSAIQSAINAAQTNGGTVYLPAGNYLVKGTGGQLLSVEGQMRILGDGYQSTLLVDSSVPDSTNVILLEPPTTGANGWGWMLDSFRIAANSGTPAANAVAIDLGTSGTLMARFLMQNCFIDQLGACSIYLYNPVNEDGFFTSCLLNNVFNGGLSLYNAGDSINIIGNTITGANTGVALSQVSGAADVVIAYNNITSDGGAVLATTGSLGGGGQLKVLHNQIEQTVASTGAYSSMISVVGDSSNSLGYSYIEGNNLNAHDNCDYNIYLDYADHTYINNNVFNGATVTDVYATDTCSSTTVNYWP